ncbi:MAG: DNA polymerase III subunit alpha [Chitinophagales bacterium]
MFIHLHTHSCFSFLDGGSSIEDLVQRAVELDLPALALTDHDNLCGAVKFHSCARKAGIKPIQGVEVTLNNGSHLVLLAQSPIGYRSLCHILSRAHLENPRRSPRVSMDNLKENTAGLIALSGCRQGKITGLILARQYEKARQAAISYRDIWGKDNFYLEVQDISLPGTRQLNQLLLELAGELGMGVVATNNVHYALPEDFRVHDILTCVRTLTRVQDTHRERPLNAEAYLKSSQEMQKLFRDCPQALENTWRIAERCSPALEFDRPYFPDFDLPPGERAEVWLKNLTYQGAIDRYGRVSEAARDRLDHELSIINELGYAGYFLVVWDIVNYARRERIRYAGRGSAADSLVAYCLGITEVDALERGLLFERFMSRERGEKPDIDIDFDARCRDQVAAYVYRKYGDDRVASVCTYNTFRGRSAVREIGKALDLPAEEIDCLAKKLPHYMHADHIRNIMTQLPELRSSNLGQDKFKLLLDLCEKVAGFPRFLGTHLGGLVVSREPLNNLSPLQEAAKGVVITQFDKDDVEELGLIKLDLLSLRTLSAVDDAVISIRERGESLNYDKIPLNDSETYQLINSGQTIGMFQLESPAQRALQARLNTSHMEDIVASVAIIRPGPIKGNMVEPYINRRQGREEVVYLHPELEPILKKTYGVILFQEQVIEIATVIARFSPGEADQLRRVMTHARSQRVMDEIGQTFIKRAVDNGIDQATAEGIFSCITGYASYGFCEAHAAAFATTSFKTAYLLCHYPADFYAAILSNQPMGYYPPHVICNEARRRGIVILSPDINHSGSYFEVEDHNGTRAIRISLGCVKGLTRRGLSDIIENRPFISLDDLAVRTALERNEIENLIMCGALGDFDSNRRSLLSQLPECLQRRRDEEQVLLLGSNKSKDKIPDFSEDEKYAREFAILGIDVRGHIMTRFRAELVKRGFRSSKDLTGLEHGARVKVAGVLLRPHRPPTRSGRITVFLSLEDEFGLTDVTVFEDVYQQFGSLIFSPQTAPLAVEGIIQRRGNGVSVLARRLERWGT